MWLHVTSCDLMSRWPSARTMWPRTGRSTWPSHAAIPPSSSGTPSLRWPKLTFCDLMWPKYDRLTDLAPDPHHRHPALLLPRLHELQDLLRDPEKQICTHLKTLKCTIIHSECTIYFQLLSGRQSKKRQSECTLGIINNLYKWKDLCQLFENIISQIAIVP